MSCSRLKLCVVKVSHRGKEMTDGQKLLANEQTDCSRAGLAQASPAGFDGFDGYDGFDGFDGYDGS